jgi:streptogramin lyase
MGHRLRNRRGRYLLGLLAIAVVATVMAASAVAQATITEWGVLTANSQPANLAADASGSLWFTEFAGNKIGKINQNGVIQEMNVPTADSQPWGIAVDGGGRVWFTESAGNKIGNMTPGGVFGQDNIPTANSQPTGIAPDGSGNVWFAESKGNKIGRLTSAGTFNEYDVPTSNSQPWAVAVDSSGNVWFTERSGNKLGRMTSAGQFTEFGIPTSGSGPTGIAIDPSGNLWFAEYDGNKVGMMTPTGAFTEYNLPTAYSKPTWLAIDKVGGVWYAGSGSNSIGRVSDGTVTEYSASSPFGIAVDPSGNVWFTEKSANRIGRTTGAAAASPTSVPPTATAMPIGVPSPVPTPVPALHDARYFNATGFRIDNDVFWDYFNRRGGINSFGYPVSRTFTFLGFTTQFFQRAIVQLGPGGAARTMNMLDPGLMPYTKINGSTFPAPDADLAMLAPVSGTADYGAVVQEFIDKYAPNQYEGMNLNFNQGFQNTVTLQDAFPQGNANPGLLPLLNLELWGVPTSKPSYDPNNHNFVYLRFQRGIMHYDASNGATQGLLLADYLKSMITGVNLPTDLDQQSSGSQFYHQYNPSKPSWVDRPDQLPATDLTFAFERQ